MVEQRERQVEEEAKQLSNTELSGTSFMRNSNHIKTYKDEYKYLQPTLSTRERARARALGTHDACLAEVYQQCAGGRHLRYVPSAPALRSSARARQHTAGSGGLTLVIWGANHV